MTLKDSINQLRLSFLNSMLYHPMLQTMVSPDFNNDLSFKHQNDIIASQVT